MAYLHCHSCGWSQDDFWSWKYNPIIKIWRDIKWLIKPRFISIDKYVVDDLIKYTGVKVKNHGKPNEAPKLFSWKWLVLEFVKEWKNFRKMRYWTYKDWNKAVVRNNNKWPNCPKCNKHSLDID